MEEDTKVERCNNEVYNELVPFFKDKPSQIKAEFSYLLVFVIIFSIALFALQLGIFPVDHPTKVYLFSFIGGALGGWTFSAKWFYRVIGRGKYKQHSWTWGPEKFYWRIFVPIMAGISSLALFTLAISDILPFIAIKSFTGASSFGFSFVAGYFTDVIFSKLATWIEITLTPQNCIKSDAEQNQDNHIQNES